MSLVPSLDLRPKPAHPNQPGADALAQLPQNVEAEQALLGCILYDNGAYERVGDHLKPEHFFEPFHQVLYAGIERQLRKGEIAEPIILGEAMERYDAYEELGGLRYLAALVDRAPPAASAPTYANAIYDLALRRDLIRISNDIAYAARTGEGDQTGREQLEAAEGQLYELGETGQIQGGLQTFEHFVTSAIGMAAEAYNRDGSLSGISTGLIDLDQKTGGLHDTNLLIIAARPSMGKSALAANIGFNVAKSYAYAKQPDGTHKTLRGGRVGFFSLEMSGEELALRIVAEVSGVPSERLRRGDVQAHEFGRVRDAAIEIQEAPLFIDDTGGLSLSRLAGRARRMKRRHGLDLVIVDYLQLLLADKARGGANRVEQLGEITQGLKALAKELRVPVIALAQLSRAVEQRDDKKPQLADLRESGSIEQDADVVMFIYREAYYLSRQEPREGTDEHMKWREQMDRAQGQADIIIGKQRHGPIGTVRLAFNEALTRFGNLARDRGTVEYGKQYIDFTQPRGADD